MAFMLTPKQNLLGNSDPFSGRCSGGDPLCYRGEPGDKRCGGMAEVCESS